MNTKGFMTGWLVANLPGWMIGIYSAYFRIGDIVSNLNTITGLWQIPDVIGLMLVMICIPLGLGLGIMQCSQLGYWKIPAFPWIFATAVGWAIPFMAFSRIRYLLLFGDLMGLSFTSYLDSLGILYPVGLLTIGAGIGLLQSLVIGQSLSKPGLWISANAVGLLVLGLLVNEIFKIPMSLRFADVFYILENYDSFLIPPNLMWPIIWIVLPFLATLITALPTGIVLVRFGNKPPDIVSGNAEKPTANPSP